MYEGVFKDLKILDFCWAIAGPWMVKYFADMGAEIIHVESRRHPDLIRTGPPFQDGKPGVDSSIYFLNYHCNKYGMGLNLRHEKAKGIMRGLIEWADVLVENFMPGVMDSWGFSYEEIKKIKPDIIMVSQSQCGQTGPIARVRGTGVQLAAFSGFNYITGWPDREPSVLYGGFTDCPAARFGAAALIAALIRRRRTGQGMYIDLSQLEAGVQLLAPAILDYRLTGRVARRQGNFHPSAAPHGVFPCRGDDRWCAIAVFTDDHWQGLCQAMGDPAWAKEKRFLSFTARKENKGELEEKISQWTKTLDAFTVMARLQELKVPAGVAQKSEDLYCDPQLDHRGFFWEVEHPVMGKHRLESEAFIFSKTPPELRMPSACMGEHTEWICREILGLSDEQFVEYLTEGVFE